MPVQVLIVTSIRSLGELIKQALGETGRYRADLVYERDQALERVAATQYDLVLVDLGAVKAAPAFIAELRAAAEVRVVAMPAQPADQDDPAFQGLVDAWLSLPFYLPNLLDTLDAVSGDLIARTASSGALGESGAFLSAVTRKSVTPAPAPDWLQDVNRVAQHLTRLSLESAAHAALITRGSQTWAYAGQLSQPAMEELARALAHYWAHDGGSDLARFIRLESTNSEYMLYATSLGGDYVLALAFETEMPFSEMRTRAGVLARKLSQPPREGDDAVVAETASLEDAALPAELPTEDVAIPSDWRPDQGAYAEGRQAFLEDLLKSLEIPAPEASVGESAPHVDVEVSAVEPEADTRPRPEEDHFLDGEPLQTAEVSPDADTRPTVVVTDGAQERSTDLAAKAEDNAESRDQLAPEPDTLTLHNLTYACVLLPRLPQHHLVGDLADRLAEWVQQLSLAFGWRLEHLAVRPNYLHWIAVVPPNTSPGMMVYNLRLETSRRVFEEFPRLERDNPSGEFWASGYLIVNGRDPFTRQMVQEFIDNVRARQGVE